MNNLPYELIFNISKYLNDKENINLVKAFNKDIVKQFNDNNIKINLIFYLIH